MKNSRSDTGYTPPQNHDEIVAVIRNLEHFINDSTSFSADPLIVSRLTAAKYLDALETGGFVQKWKIGRSN